MRKESRWARRVQHFVKAGGLLFAHTATCRGASYGIPPWDSNSIDSEAKALKQFEEDFRVFFHEHLHWPSLTVLESDRAAMTKFEPPQQFTLDPVKRCICNVGPVTDRKDIDRENPHRRRDKPVTAPPGCVIFDDQSNVLEFLAL